jgi:hypothetical protein
VLKVHGLCLLVLAICATFAVSFEREDVECPGCGVRSGTGGFTVVDANDNVLPGWCCGVVARFSPGVQVNGVNLAGAPMAGSIDRLLTIRFLCNRVRLRDT